LFRKRSMTLTKKNEWTGQLFVLPFIIGFIFFFLRPLYDSFRFVFSNVSVVLGGYSVQYTGLKNLIYLFTVDAKFKPNLYLTLGDLAWKVPIILIASLFIALIMKQKFFGRTFVRAVFFLPVIVASGVIISVIKQDNVANSMLTGSMIANGTIYQSSALQDMIVNAGLSSEIVRIITIVSNNLFDLLWRTGIQMIIFLAGLQTISPSLYESSAMEGATAWEDFWKITIPMLAPIILINLIYTIVDTFTDSGNVIMQEVMTLSNNIQLSMASAMAWSYFFLIGIILYVIFGISSKLSKGSN
jgi:ABC-type sugar transport system permease subunit